MKSSVKYSGSQQRQQPKHFKTYSKISPLPFIKQQQPIFPLPLLPYFNTAMEPYTQNVPEKSIRDKQDNQKRSISLRPSSNKKNVKWIDSIAQSNLEGNQNQQLQQKVAIFTFDEKKNSFLSNQNLPADFQSQRFHDKFSSPINRIHQRLIVQRTPQKKIQTKQINNSKSIADLEAQNSLLKKQASYYKSSYFAKQLQNQKLIKSQQQLQQKFHSIVKQKQNLEKNLQSLKCLQSKLSSKGSNIIKISLNGNRSNKQKNGDQLIKLSSSKVMKETQIDNSECYGYQSYSVRENKRFEMQSEQIYKLKVQLQRQHLKIQSLEKNLNAIGRQLGHQRKEKENLSKQNQNLRKEILLNKQTEVKHFKELEYLNYELQVVKMDFNTKQNQNLNLKQKMLELQYQQKEQKQLTVKKAIQNEQAKIRLNQGFTCQYNTPQSIYDRTQLISPQKVTANTGQTSVESRIRQISHYYQQKIELLEQQKLQSRRANQYRDFQISQLNKLLMKKKEELQLCYEQKLQLKKELSILRNNCSVRNSRSESWMNEKNR